MAKAVFKPELAKKIKRLREILRCSQEGFSELLHVSRPQVSRWEKGTEVPSNEKLIALGNVAHKALQEARNVPDAAQQLLSLEELLERTQALEKLAEHPDSDWFWELAGMNLGAVRESIWQTMAQQSPAARGAVANIPRLDIPSLRRFVKRGAVDPKRFAAGFIPFPALFAPEGAAVICVQATDRLAGSPLFAGDLSLVRLAQQEGDACGCDKLPSLGFESLFNCLVAVFCESMPIQRELSPDAARWLSRNQRLVGPTVEHDLKELRSRTTPESEKRADKYRANATAAGVLFGTLRVQSHENWDGDLSRLEGDNPWRLVLDCGATWSGLTLWSTQEFPWDGSLRHRLNAGVHVLGAVIGWLRAAGEASKV
jgi:transcriptional regulator with XRE-family HTH domain